MSTGFASVTLDELDRQGQLLDIGAATAAALADTGLVEVRPAAQGRWRVLPCGYVGAVRAEDLQVQVTPKEKVGLGRLLFLLGYARDPGFRPEDVAGTGEPDLWPALAGSLARLVRSALAGGVLQGYSTLDESLRTVRGRIRISDQITRRLGLMVPLEVSYDEFTTDIAENRILRTALHRMLAVPRLPARARAELAHLDRRLEGTQVIRTGAPLPPWRRTRLNERYQPALRLAELVLHNTSAEAGPGGVRVAAFVVSMWQVFEGFVTTALAEALRRYPGRTQTDPQFVSCLDQPLPGHERGAITISLDAVHLVHGVPRLIFDAKYKAGNPHGRYPNADHYQMLAYCTALSVPIAWLVYARGSRSQTVRAIKNTQISIVEYSLDLSAEPPDLLRQVEDLARRAWNDTERATHGITGSGPPAACRPVCPPARPVLGRPQSGARSGIPRP
jgi:5-methylcytosine-specific restriction enzyme subunit McrC